MTSTKNKKHDLYIVLQELFVKSSIVYHANMLYKNKYFNNRVYYTKRALKRFLKEL